MDVYVFILFPLTKCFNVSFVFQKLPSVITYGIHVSIKSSAQNLLETTLPTLCCVSQPHMLKMNPWNEETCLKCYCCHDTRRCVGINKCCFRWFVSDTQFLHLKISICSTINILHHKKEFTSYLEVGDKNVYATYNCNR